MIVDEHTLPPGVTAETVRTRWGPPPSPDLEDGWQPGGMRTTSEGIRGRQTDRVGWQGRSPWEGDRAAVFRGLAREDSAGTRKSKQPLRLALCLALLAL